MKFCKLEKITQKGLNKTGWKRLDESFSRCWCLLVKVLPDEQITSLENLCSLWTCYYYPYLSLLFYLFGYHFASIILLMMHLGNKSKWRIIFFCILKQTLLEDFSHAFNHSWMLKCLKIQVEIDIFFSSSLFTLHVKCLNNALNYTLMLQSTNAQVFAWEK